MSGSFLIIEGHLSLYVVQNIYFIIIIIIIIIIILGNTVLLLPSYEFFDISK